MDIAIASKMPALASDCNSRIQRQSRAVLDTKAAIRELEAAIGEIDSKQVDAFSQKPAKPKAS